MANLKPPLSPEKIAEIAERCCSIFEDFSDLRRKTGLPKLDRLDTEVYAEELQQVMTEAQIMAVRREIRRSYAFCPTAKQVGDIVRGVTGDMPALPPHVAAERRIVSKRDMDAADSELRLLTGISEEKAAENRKRAQGMIKELCEKKPIPRAPGAGEPGGVMVEHFRQLAIKRARIEETIYVPKAARGEAMMQEEGEG